jgi:hypothetical protein
MAEVRGATMAMSHKAFVFDWDAFRGELAPLLAASLGDGDTTRLVEFGHRHHYSLRDPYEGEPLGDNWAGRLRLGDVQEAAEIVLTRYYDPTADGGLGEAWLWLEDHLDAEQRPALLGNQFGPEGAPFDPGRMGSYFQDGSTARRSLGGAPQGRSPGVFGLHLVARTGRQVGQGPVRDVLTRAIGCTDASVGFAWTAR